MVEHVEKVTASIDNKELLMEERNFISASYKLGKIEIELSSIYDGILKLLGMRLIPVAFTDDSKCQSNDRQFIVNGGVLERVLEFRGYSLQDHGIQLERIFGCIPHILNPNPDAMSKMITENANTEFLHSLSRYCALQGFVKDQFGSGLIARAVE
ncbi:unnamed protein product [Dovyalis caffra]|uniref:Uncharacterized protein n=1 Tax=Dovyalis caffra TaxID=77055 RepID=A0AAV1SR41_9ROSI|nr:unnamed protein product [Dovyalis caffra]